MSSTNEEEIRGIFKLPAELLLEILVRLAFIDILSIRQCCRVLRDLTYTRALWTRRIVGLAFASLSSRKEYTKMTVSGMEAFERKHFIVSKHWQHAQPNFQSIRGMDAPEVVNRLCIVPGGRYMLVMPRRIRTYVVDLDTLDQASGQVFFELLHTNGCHFTTYNWRVGRDGAGAIFIIAEIAWPADRDTFAFWVADFSGTPQARYLGQTMIPRPVQIYRVHLDMFACSLKNTNHLLLFEWQALLLGKDKFRCSVFRYDSRISISTAHSLCILKDNSILVFDSSSQKLMLFEAPEFLLVGSLHELQYPEARTSPLWEYAYPGHNCGPMILSSPVQSPINQSSHSIRALSWLTNCLSVIHIEKSGGHTVAHSVTEAPCRAFVLGRLRCLAMTRVGENGLWEFGCYTTGEQQHYCGDEYIGESAPAALTYHGSFLLKMSSEASGSLASSIHLIPDSSESSAIKLYFDEESGRLCLLMSDAAGRPWRRVVVVDFT